MTKTKIRPVSPARRIMKGLCTLLGIVLAVMLALTLGIFGLFHQLSPVDPGDIAALTGQRMASLASGALRDLGFGGDDILAASDSGIVNILLIGQDRRAGEERSRSDAMILCSFNKSTKTLVLTSIMRDLYVEIPGYQDNRINAAYTYGGMELLDRTLSQNLGIRIDGNVEVDFGQFSKIIDALGGVTLSLRADEAAHINQEVGGTLAEGTNTLTGKQALTYSRIRKLDSGGDFSRTDRQRKLLSALLASYKTASFPTLLALVDDILPMVTTDLAGAHLALYAIELFPMLSDMQVVTHRIPADGTYTPKTVRDMSVLVADMEENRLLLQDVVTKTQK